jgi:hypothetical protein
MKNKILIIATMAFVLGACKTVKQSQDTTLTNSSDVTVNQTSETNKDIKLKVDSSKFTIDRGSLSELIAEETVVVIYAPADSAGKQSIVSITRTKRGIARNEAKNLQEDKKNSSGLRDKGDSKSAARVNASSDTKEKKSVTIKEETKLPTWLVLLLITGSIILIFYIALEDSIYNN